MHWRMVTHLILRESKEYLWTNNNCAKHYKARLMSFTKLPFFCPISVGNHTVSDQTQTHTPIEKITPQKVARTSTHLWEKKETKTAIFSTFHPRKAVWKSAFPAIVRVSKVGGCDLRPFRPLESRWGLGLITFHWSTLSRCAWTKTRKLEADLTVSIAHLQVVLESALKCTFSCI